MRYRMQGIISKEMAERALIDVIAFERESMAERVGKELSDIVSNQFIEQSLNEDSDTVLTTDLTIMKTSDFISFVESIKKLPEPYHQVVLPILAAKFLL
jgi:hypothetical protein